MSALSNIPCVCPLMTKQYYNRGVHLPYLYPQPTTPPTIPEPRPTYSPLVHPRRGSYCTRKRQIRRYMFGEMCSARCVRRCAWIHDAARSAQPQHTARPQPTTQNPQPTTHNPQPATHNPRLTLHTTPSLPQFVRLNAQKALDDLKFQPPGSFFIRPSSKEQTVTMHYVFAEGNLPLKQISANPEFQRSSRRCVVVECTLPRSISNDVPQIRYLKSLSFTCSHPRNPSLAARRLPPVARDPTPPNRN